VSIPAQKEDPEGAYKGLALDEVRRLGDFTTQPRVLLISGIAILVGTVGAIAGLALLDLMERPWLGLPAATRGGRDGENLASGDVGEGDGHVPAQQRVTRFPLRRRVQCLEEAHLAAGEGGERQAVTVEDSVAGERRQS
jgi:hypothetical protein